MLREPLLVFGLVGGSLFALYDYVGNTGLPVIEVSPLLAEQMVEERRLVLDRNLTDSERQALIDGFIDQEVLVREAIARNLHVHDGRIRHRLADKMSYLLGAEPELPNAEQIQQFYEEHHDSYRSEQLVSFEHRYFEGNREDAQRALAKLQAGEQGEASPGVRFWMGPRLERISGPELVSIFGPGFTRELEHLPAGEWRGPYQSSRGWHLVRVEAHHPPQDIPRELLQERLQTEWLAAKRTALRRERLDAMRADYQIKVAEPDV